MSKDKEDMIPEKTFSVSVAKGDIRTFHGLNSNTQTTVPPEFYEAAERRGSKLIPRSEIKKTREDNKEKQATEETKTTYDEDKLKEEKKGTLTDIMLARGKMRRDIEKNKPDLIKQILNSNPIQKVEEPKSEDQNPPPKEKTE